jgi:hypothetical protein
LRQPRIKRHVTEDRQEILLAFVAMSAKLKETPFIGRFRGEFSCRVSLFPGPY